MSNFINTDLLELAAEHLDYWEGTTISKLIEQDLANNDLDSLQAHLKESAKLMFDQEYQPEQHDLEDEEIEHIMEGI